MWINTTWEENKDQFKDLALSIQKNYKEAFNGLMR